MKLQLKFLFIALTLSLTLVPFLLAYGGVVGDFPAYLKIADELPHPTSNLLPLGFPLAIRLFSICTGEYFYSSLLLKMICFGSIIGFSVWKKFYVIETIIVMTLKSVFWIFIHQGSEYITLPFVYLYIYCFHQLLQHKIDTKSLIVYTSILSTLLVTIRYANIFICISVFTLLILTWRTNKKYRIPVLGSLLGSGLGIGLFLLFNYFLFGSFTAGGERRNDETDHFIIDTYKDFVGLINLFNPLFFIKIFDFNSILKTIGSLLLLVFDCSLIIIIYRKLKSKIDHRFTFELLVIAASLIIAILTFFAAMFQGIEPLAQRLLSMSFFMLWFALLIIIRKTNLISDQKLLYFASFSLVFQSMFLIKIPANYLNIKHKIEQKLLSYEGVPKYYYDDLKEEKISVYEIPILNKRIEKVHEHLQPYQLHKSILRLNFPQIIILKEEPKDSTNVIYSSDLK